MPGVNYDAALYGLLHDLGKPLLRYLMRAREGLERFDQEIVELLGEAKNHDEARDIVFKNLLGVDPEHYRDYENVISRADEMAAMERGLEDACPELVKAWGPVESELSSNLGVVYKHHMVPLLSPLWVLLPTGYERSLGPCATSSFRAEDAWRGLGDTMKRLVDSLKKCDSEEVSRELITILGDLKSKPVWYPPQVLSSEVLSHITSYDYEGALKRMSYYSIAKYTLDSLRKLKDVYDFEKASKGLVNTMLEVLKYSLLLTPSAVYLSLIPDISLYSHSKMVSAYAAALSTGVDKLRLILLDARGIQDFIAAPVKAKASSRVIRGRSLLAELVSTSLANYLLEMCEGLPNANVLTSEGGSLMLIVPHKCLEDEGRRVLEDVVRRTYERLKGLWFTIASSRPFSPASTSYVAALSSSGGGAGFPGVLKSLEEDLAIRKSMDNSRMIFNVGESEVAGFDAITQEPVFKAELGEGRYGLRVDQGSYDYAGRISGFKLEQGEMVSEATHLSLVAGTCNRNMISLISVYVYGLDDSQGALKPREELIVKLVESVASKLGGHRLLHELSEKIGDSEYKVLVGLVPLPTLGSLHILVSTKDVVDKDIVEVFGGLAGKILSIIRGGLSTIAEAESRLRISVDVRIINTGSEFIESLSSEGLRQSLKELKDLNVDVSLGVFYTGTYHPVTSRLEPGSQRPVMALADLDEYPLVGMAKIDGDELGEVKKLLSFSPSRLISFSDLLTVLFNVKTHLVSLKYAESLGMVGRGPIMLYAGGDDVAFYGHWLDVIKFLYHLYDSAVRAVYPLSFSSSVVVEAGDYPLLELYDRVVRVLRSVKSEGRGGVVIEPFASPRVLECSGACKLVRVMSPWREQAGWPKPLTALATLEGVHSVLKLIEKSSLSDYKRDLQVLSTIAALDDVELRALCSGDGGSDGLYRLVRRETMYSYISAMREDALRELGALLGKEVDQAVNLHHVPGEDVRKCLMRIVEAKALIDLLLTSIRLGQERSRRVANTGEGLEGSASP